MEKKLLTAIDNKDLDSVINIVNSNKVDINYINNGGITPLIKATQKGYLPIIIYLVEHGAIVNKGDNNMNTPLHYAIFGSYEKRSTLPLVKYLVGRGADLYITDSQGFNAINLAASIRAYDIIKYLVGQISTSRKYDILNQGNNEGNTPLHSLYYKSGSSSTRETNDIVRFLIRNGANVKIKNKKKKHSIAFSGQI